MNPILFSIGDFDVRWYSVLIIVSIFISYIMINSESNRFGIKKEFVFNLIFWTVIFGIIGARVYYVVFNLDYYLSNPGEIIKIWNGGLAIHGGLLFGFITILIYCKKYKASVARMLDIIVPALLISQAISRWGNFFNGEAYGSIVPYQTLIDLKIIPSFVIDNMLINGAYRLPMFYFESIWCFIGFVLLLIIRRRKYIKVGQITCVYLMWYSFARFIIESYRSDSLMIGDLKVAKIVSTIMFVIGLICMFIQSRKPKLDELYNKSEEKEIRF